MSLKPCRECGSQVSMKARECLSCGIRNPSGSAAKSRPNGCIGSIRFLFLVILMMAIGYKNSIAKNEPNTIYIKYNINHKISKHKNSNIVIIGQHAYLIHDTIGCTSLNILNKFRKDEIDAQLAHDRIREKNVWRWAAENGCQHEFEGSSWLVVDLSGFLSQRARIRRTFESTELPTRPVWIASYNMLKRYKTIKVGRSVKFIVNSIACSLNAERVQIGTEHGSLIKSIHKCINIKQNKIVKVVGIETPDISKYGEDGYIFGFNIKNKEYWSEQKNVKVK